MEHGATRSFQAEKLLEEEERRVQKECEDKKWNNSMKVLQNLTKDSKLEMGVLENLQKLRLVFVGTGHSPSHMTTHALAKRIVIPYVIHNPCTAWSLNLLLLSLLLSPSQVSFEQA